MIICHDIDDKTQVKGDIDLHCPPSWIIYFDCNGVKQELRYESIDFC